MEQKRIFKYFAFQSAREMFSSIEEMWRLEDVDAKRRTRFAMIGSGDIHQCRIENEDGADRELQFIVAVLWKRNLPFAVTTARSEDWDDEYSKLIGIQNEPQILVELKD